MMNALLLTVAILGQSQTSEETQAQQNREWLLARLHAANNFDENMFFEVEAKLGRMNPSQLRVLREAAEIRMKEAQRVKELQQQAVMNQALLNLQKAQSFRDHLKREFDITLLQKKRETELFRTMYLQRLQQPYGVYNYGYGGGAPNGTICIGGRCMTPVWQYRNGRWFYGY